MNPRSKQEEIEALSREPFGDGLATWLWIVMEGVAVGTGIIYNHRDYCGIGLVRTSDGVALGRVWDGDPGMILKWTNLPEFVNYWSQQSDLGLSGADILHPELLAHSDFELNNQRITRARVCGFLEKAELFVAVPAGVTFSPFVKGFFPPQQCFLSAIPVGFTFRFSYSTSDRVQDFLSEPRMSGPTSAAPEVQRLFECVPNLDLKTNELKLTFTANPK